MSIDARVQAVHRNPDGSGYLILVDRPATDPSKVGIAGQKRLHFRTAPENVEYLEGKDIWGGSSEIMFGDVKIADRIGYTQIAFKLPAIPEN